MIVLNVTEPSETLEAVTLTGLIDLPTIPIQVQRHQILYKRKLARFQK